MLGQHLKYNLHDMFYLTLNCKFTYLNVPMSRYLIFLCLQLSFLNITWEAFTKIYIADLSRIYLNRNRSYKTYN